MDSKEYLIFQKNNKKIGVAALVEYDWVKDLITIDQDDVEFIEFIEKGKELGKFLRETENCDLVIALTHMRVPNMLKLAQNVSEYDLLLGGHDNFFHLDVVIETVCLISGTDFRDFTSINIFFHGPDEEVQAYDNRKIINLDNKKLKVVIDHVFVTK